MNKSYRRDEKQGSRHGRWGFHLPAVGVMALLATACQNPTDTRDQALSQASKGTAEAVVELRISAVDAAGRTVVPRSVVSDGLMIQHLRRLDGQRIALTVAANRTQGLLRLQHPDYLDGLLFLNTDRPGREYRLVLQARPAAQPLPELAAHRPLTDQGLGLGLSW